MRRVLLPALVAALLANAMSANLVSVNLAAAADEPVTKQLYGGGVHAYFAKEYKEAHELLSTAVAGKTEDPRVYYFRGLAQWQLGQPDEAKADFTTGADLEATAADDLYSIDKALERIQGKARLLIETARVTARSKEAARRLTENEKRFNRIKANEPNILEGVKPPAKAPAKTSEPPKANATTEPPKTEGTAEGTAQFDPLREAAPPVTPRKVAAADDSKPAPKTVEAAPATPKEPAPAPAEPKVVAKAKADPVPQPSSPPGKKATTALARIVGKMAQQYAEEMADSIQKAQQAGGGLAPPPKAQP